MNIDLATLKKFVHQQPYIQLAVTAMEALEPHFEGHSRLTAQPTGATNSEVFGLALIARPIDGGHPINVLVMEFFHSRVAIPTMILPHDLYHRGAMINALGCMTDAAVPLNYQVVVRDLVKSQHRRLIRRGAHQLPKNDEVALHTGMNFQPSTGPTV